jgi:hypothetical protein
MRVGLIVAGKTEREGLPKALHRLFPAHTFVAIEDVPGRPFPSFTSHPLPPPPASVPPMVDKLVAAAAACVDPEEPRTFDHVLILDDLELANRDSPRVVVEVFRAAVVRHLSRFDIPRRRALAEALRERVSFHLSCPMIEACFFGSPPAISDVGVTAAFHIRSGDHEDFESTDLAYLSAPETACTRWQRYKIRGDRPKWIGAGPARKFHPKGYIQWLMIDPVHPCCTTYAEATRGADALATLDWAKLLRAPDRATYARALVADLALALGPPALQGWEGTEAPLTSITRDRPDRVLRNL